MEEPEVNRSLMQADLFQLFKQQLKKDFEGAGLKGEFVEELPAEFDELKRIILAKISSASKTNALAGLLYRIDLSENQISAYLKKYPDFSFEQAVAELIIKRTLQKVILKKRFS